MATAEDDLRRLEREDVSPEERASIRRKLFGTSSPELAYSVNPEAEVLHRRYAPRAMKAGTLKTEAVGYRSGYFVGLKVYGLFRSDSSPDVSRFKSVSNRSGLRLETFRELVKGQRNLHERRLNLRAKGGISVVESSRRCTSYRSFLNYKLRSLGPNVTTAFD